MEKFIRMNDFDFDFQSISQRYKGPEEKDLHLKIYEYGNDVLEVNLINKHFSRLRRSLQKQVVLLFIVMIITLLMKITLNFYNSIINFLLLFSLIIKIWSISNLVKNGTKTNSSVSIFIRLMTHQLFLFLQKSLYFVMILACKYRPQLFLLKATILWPHQVYMI